MQVLLVSSDPSLREEFEAALENLKDFSPSIHTADSPRQGVEVARIRRPDLVCIEMDASGKELERFASELSIHAPRTLIGAVYRSDAFGSDSSETAIIAGVRAGVSDFLRRPLSTAEVAQLLRRARDGTTATRARHSAAIGQRRSNACLACSVPRERSAR